MPAIPVGLLDAVVYLYPTVDDALAGEKVGATGFLVTWPPNDSRPHHLYVVTAKHVIAQCDVAPVVRLNTHDGATDTVQPEEWLGHPDGDDIVVAPLGLSGAYHRFRAVDGGMLVTEEALGAFPPGNDAFFLGRFIGHDGKQRNAPTVRFGNIAMMGTEKVWSADSGLEQESFLVEMRSLPGYSGSAVFVYSMSGGGLGAGSSGMQFPRLLGLDWAHLRDFKPVLGPDKKSPAGVEMYVEQNSGMMAVVPAWKIVEVLEDEELREMRKKRDDQSDKDGEHVAPDYADRPQEEGVTRDQFFRDLTKATRRLDDEPEKERS